MKTSTIQYGKLMKDHTLLTQYRMLVNILPVLNVISISRSLIEITTAHYFRK